MVVDLPRCPEELQLGPKPQHQMGAGGGHFVADRFRGSQGLREGPLGTRKWLSVTPFGFSCSHKS